MLSLPEYSLTTLDTIHNMDCFRLMDGLAAQSIDAIITDMPYGTTACAWDTRVDLPTWWTAVKRILKPRGVMVTTASQPFTSLLVCSNLDWFRYEWIGVKPAGTGYLNANRQPMKNHENILVFAQGEHIYYPQMSEGIAYRATRGAVGGFVRDKTVGGYLTINFGERYPLSVIKCNWENGLHPTQKPVALYEYLIRTYTQPGDIVLDPFCGSGTTAVAAFRTGRHYICGDSSQEYVTLARQRLATCDPYQPTPLPDGSVQLSLFG